MAVKDYPKAIQPYIELGFEPETESKPEWVGECPFCGKSKFYVNEDTGMFSCKSGACSLEGNVCTFMTRIVKDLQAQVDAAWMNPHWLALANDRKLPVEHLKAVGLVYDKLRSRWIMPVYNNNRTVMTVKFYYYGRRLRALSSMDILLYGAEELTEKSSDTVWFLEGEWDRIAMRALLANAGRATDIVVATPSAGTFKKDVWKSMLSNKHVILCYDNDDAGRKGSDKAGLNLDGNVSSLRVVKWSSELPSGFDIRDLYVNGGTIELLEGLLEEYVAPKSLKGEGVRDRSVELAARPRISCGKRPTFSSVMDVYKRNLFMKPEMIDGLRIMFAVIHSNQMDGDPLWVHFAGPPGSGKTELLVSLESSGDVHIESVITNASLVSGYPLKDGGDPSLLPRLYGKTFVLKDYTEILSMGDGQKKEIYSTLRGAYDGHVSKPFGNGIIRDYTGYFSMMTGVTQAIFAERGASLGERFLIYHIERGVGFDADDVIMAAIASSGKETKMKEQLREAAASFLHFRIDEEDIPEIPMEYLIRLSALAQLVAMLRAEVPRSKDRERILYAPQHEVGTRIGKQLTKLIRGLALTYDDFRVCNDAYRICARVAMDTCIGFNLDILTYLIEVNEAKSAAEISAATKIPHSTCYDHLRDMEILKVLTRVREDNPKGMGAPIMKYSPSDIIRRHWDRADIAVVLAGEKLTRRQSMEVRTSR